MNEGKFSGSDDALLIHDLTSKWPSTEAPGHPFEQAVAAQRNE